jgi:hypothetical protein
MQVETLLAGGTDSNASILVSCCVEKPRPLRGNDQACSCLSVRSSGCPLEVIKDDRYWILGPGEPVVWLQLPMCASVMCLGLCLL